MVIFQAKLTELNILLIMYDIKMGGTNAFKSLLSLLFKQTGPASSNTKSAPLVCFLSLVCAKHNKG